VGGVEEILGSDRGLLANRDDQNGLVAATVRMLDDEELRETMGRVGYDYVTRFHSAKALTKTLLDVYRRVLLS
jgi:glycosyltransferase involved in cell wall biosynthesis